MSNRTYKWSFDREEIEKYGWVLTHSPDTFMVRDSHNGELCLLPLIPMGPRTSDEDLGIAGWIESFNLGHMILDCQATVIVKNGVYAVWAKGMNGKEWAMTCTDPLNALDTFTNLVGEIRREVDDVLKARGIFIGRDPNWRVPVSTSFAAREHVRPEPVVFDRQNLKDWGNWS